MSIYIYVCSVCLVIQSYKLLISCCIYKVMFVRLLELLKIPIDLHKNCRILVVKYSCKAVLCKLVRTGQQSAL